MSNQTFSNCYIGTGYSIILGCLQAPVIDQFQLVAERTPNNTCSCLWKIQICFHLIHVLDDLRQYPIKTEKFHVFTFTVKKKRNYKKDTKTVFFP